MTSDNRKIDPRLSLHKTRPLPVYLSLLVDDRRTGVLSATSEDGRRELVLVEGEVRAARSEREEEKLGLWLVGRDLLSEKDRSLTLLAQGSADAPPLGHLLVTKGLIELSDLERELQELALTIVRRAAASPRTYCEFRNGKRVEQPDTLPNVTTQQILLEVGRTFPDREAKLEALGDRSQRVWATIDMDTIVQELPLTPTEAFFLSRMEGSATIDSILKTSSLSRDQVIDALFSLATAQVLAIGPPPHPVVADTPAARGRASNPAAQTIDETTLEPAALDERRNLLRLAREVTRVDHYRALGLKPGATSAEIRDAWRESQRQYDPGRVAESHLTDCGEALERVHNRAEEAYEVLSDPRSRERYESVLKQVLAEKDRLTDRKSRAETDPGVRSQIVDANIQRAEELMSDGEIYLAIQLLEQACALEPRPPALLRLAQLLLRNPLWSGRALATLRRAIEVDPRHVDSWIELAEYWRRRNNTERQRKALERALATNPDNERANQMYQQLAGRRELDRLLKRARNRDR